MIHTPRTMYRRFAVAILAGVAVSSAEAQEGTVAMRGYDWQSRLFTPRPIANLVYDVQTGGFTARPFDWRPDASPVWLNNNADHCGTGARLGLIDDPDLDGDTVGDFGATDVSHGFFPLTDSVYLFWGGVEPDTVVTHVVVAYATVAPDTDVDEDGVGDGIPGFDLTLRFSDGDTGFGNQLTACDAPGYSGRCCVFEFTIPSLPGAAVPLAPGEMATYLLTLDFSTIPSLLFELGDSNGNDDAGSGHSGSAVYGRPTSDDFDGDGYMDFSYQIVLEQSTALSRGANAFLAVADRSEPRDVGPTDPPGIFDGFDVYERWDGHVCGSDTAFMVGSYEGTFWFGGFDCDADPRIPYASGFLELYGFVTEQGCSAADLAGPFGTLDFSDVLAFLTAFAAMSPDADLAEPSGAFDFSDVQAFLVAFGEGCP